MTATSQRATPAAELARTARAQAEAADPTVCAWVSANAGTGKTHVLTNRVLRLLVAGTAPERILCLTYTRAAAAEMSQRVFDRLAQWVTAPQAKLAASLAELLARSATPAELSHARDLFTRAIETPGGLKVQTIHAFAERLLQRFPLEAGIPPDFAILDDATSLTLRNEAILDVLTRATAAPEGPLGRALETTVAYAADDRFDELITQALAKRDWLEAAARIDLAAADELAGAETVYRRALGLAADADLATTEATLAGALSDADIARVRIALAEGGKTDAEQAERLSRAAGARSPGERIAALQTFFLIQNGEPRKNLMTKRPKAAYPELDAQALRAQDIFVRLSEQHAGLLVLAATLALMRLACAVQQRYVDLKHRRAALDFDDLIRATSSLLSDSSQAEWVLFKLDGGLDHILVDEAQDTSPAQWRIVQSLAKEFFAGSGAREDTTLRTVFAVGDEKQSIYGFQGAEPRKFAEMGALFETMAQQAGQAWRRVPLTLSFRTVAPVLETVDRVFADAARAAAITASGETIRHAANRAGAAGLVEIWQPEVTDDPGPLAIWSPLADPAISSPVDRLAERIAETIGGWLADGERLASENRPVRAGDILVLVRKRQPFAPAMVAALKKRGIAVAGADRIRLTEQLAARDLMALMDFLLLPEDDLALACVLKSPLFDLGDDELMAIASGRKGRLWSALLRASETDARFAPAATWLKRWRTRADIMPPFELLAEILDRDGMRRRLLSRLGPEAAEPIDELMSLALAYDEGAPPSLQGFAAALRASSREIKRDMEHGRDEVRVMTVHGAKGLEAPIVFLPDTCTNKSGMPGSLVALDASSAPPANPAPVLWALKGASRIGAVTQARTAARERERQELDRLLYVALTRTRDRLYVAGFEGSRGRDAGCWWDLVNDALADSLVTTTDAQGRTVRRLESPQTAPPEAPRRATHAIASPLPPPDWATRPAPREPALAVPLAPSRLAPLETDAEGDPVETPRRQTRDEPPTLAPAAQADGNRFLRGTITHALLEHLPGLPRAARAEAARNFVAARGATLSARTQASIVAETLAVLHEGAFADLFGPSSRAEVPIVAALAAPDGNGRSLRIAGQIDRLVRRDHDVLIVDYKTNRPPPRDVAGVAETYLLQLAAYRLAVAQVYPGLAVRAALLWTDGPHLMPVPDALLDAAAGRLFTRDPATLDAP